MASKKPLFGVNNYHKRTPKKRPGRHTKRINKENHTVKKIEDKVVNYGKNYCYNFIIFKLER